MANFNFSQLPQSASISGAEIIPIMQSGVTKQVSISSISVSALSGGAALQSSVDSFTSLSTITQDVTGGVTLNMNNVGLNTVSLTISGTAYLKTSNRVGGKSINLRIVSDANSHTFVFPSWKFIGIAPTSIAANKIAILSLQAYGTNETDIVASYAAEL